MSLCADGNCVLNFKERVQQLENQLQEMEMEKEKELSALRKKKKELIHSSQPAVRECFITVDTETQKI